MTEIIRLATLEDASNLVKLFDDLGYPSTSQQIYSRLKNLLLHPDYFILVLEADKKIIGLCGLCKMMFFEHDDYYMRILAFVIDNNYRNQGYGKKLLKESEKFSINQSCSIITLNSGNRTERINAHKFYTSNGYSSKSTGFTKKISPKHK